MPISNFFISKILNRIRLLERFNDDDIDVIRYSLQAILWEIEKFLILILLFTIIDKTINFLIIFFVVVSIRLFAGGYHSKTALNCLFMSTAMFSLSILIMPKISLNSFTIIVASSFSLMTTALCAPIYSRQKEAIINKDNNNHKKVIALIFTFIYVLLALTYRTYTYSILWIIVLQNVQLLYEYTKRKGYLK